MNLVLRTGTDAKPLVAAVRREIQGVDSIQPVQRIRTMEEALDEFVAQPRFNMLLLGTFALLVPVLAAIGAYGAWRSLWRGAHTK